MRCLPEVDRLVRLGLGRQQLSDRALEQSRRAVQACDEQLQAVAEQQAGLRQVLRESQLHERVVGQAELTRHLRQNAVLRRQAHTLELESAQLRQQRQRLLDTCSAQQRQRVALAHKQHSYQQLQQRLRGAERMRQSRREEAEIEDFLTSRT